MLYLIRAKDAPDALDRRIELRDSHIEYWTQLGIDVQIGGAMMDGDGDDARPVGSFLIVEANSREQAQQLIDGDPFTKEGVFSDDITIARFRPGIGRWKEA